jgi:hypothetical protein
MLVIVASAWDTAARGLASQWGARLLTPKDLSRSGWRCRFGSPEPGNAVVDGEVVAADAIRGLLTRLPWVTEGELDHIAAHDRAYVAAEMHAFLFAWLSRLACPVLNRPTPFCLSGPSWRHEQWILAAARLGIPVRKAHRRAHLDTPPQQGAAASGLMAVTVVGDQSAGAANPSLVQHTRSIAAVAGCVTLTAYYEEGPADYQLAGVSLWPDITDSAVCDILLRSFGPRTGRS